MNINVWIIISVFVIAIAGFMVSFFGRSWVNLRARSGNYEIMDKLKVFKIIGITSSVLTFAGLVMLVMSES